MNKPSILVVEDDVPVRCLITTTLKTHGYKYLTASNGETAIMMTTSHNPDIMLLDLGLPDIDGIEVIRSVRTWSNLPIIVLSARSEDSDKIEALDNGADDYLTKPFLMQELLLRMQHILRRTYRDVISRNRPGILRLGDRTVHLDDAAVVLADGTRASLTATELGLLRKLAENRGHVVTYDALCASVWGEDYYGYENSLSVHIRHLREKLEPEPSHPKILLTQRGIGYRLAKEATE